MSLEFEVTLIDAVGFIAFTLGYRIPLTSSFGNTQEQIPVYVSTSGPLQTPTPHLPLPNLYQASIHLYPTCCTSRAAPKQSQVSIYCVCRCISNCQVCPSKESAQSALPMHFHHPRSDVLPFPKKYNRTGSSYLWQVDIGHDHAVQGAWSVLGRVLRVATLRKSLA